MARLFGTLISFSAGALVSAAALHHAQSPDATDRTSPQPAIVAQQSGTSAPESDRDKTPARNALQTASKAARAQGGTLTEDTVECCLKVAEDIEPGLAKRLKAQQINDPEQFARQLRMNAQRLLDLCELRSQDPTLYDLKLQQMKFAEQVARLGRELRHALNNGNEQVVIKLEDELRKMLRAQVFMDVAIRSQVLSKLEAHVREERARLDAMMNQIDATIDTRLEMIRNNEWPPTQGPVASEGAVIPPE